jgi:hypothetical protein
MLCACERSARRECTRLHVYELVQLHLRERERTRLWVKMLVLADVRARE